MKFMSFFLTTDAFLSGEKDVTRRLGWKGLKPGDEFIAVKKLAYRLKPEEPLTILGKCKCIHASPEPLDCIIKHQIRGDQSPIVNGRICYRTEMMREGFPDLTAEQFVEMFCREMKCLPSSPVQRIVFCCEALQQDGE